MINSNLWSTSQLYVVWATTRCGRLVEAYPTVPGLWLGLINSAWIINSSPAKLIISMVCSHLQQHTKWTNYEPTTCVECSRLPAASPYKILWRFMNKDQEQISLVACAGVSKLCTIVYKLLHGLAPGYLAELCIPVARDSCRRNLWLADKNELQFPRTFNIQAAIIPHFKSISLIFSTTT